MNNLKNPTVNCIGVIMDGNRRFAKSKGEISAWGHKMGYENFKNFLKWAKEEKIKTIIAYCFSSENWKRGEEEIVSLNSLFDLALDEILSSAEEERIVFIGDRNRFSKNLVEKMKKVEEKTRENIGLNVILAMSYGGRDEIIRAAKSFLCTENDNLDEETFSKYLDTKDFPDPEMIIRTGGEKRISNFLLWQSAYSEFFFTDTLWPEFTKEEFESMLQEYGKRKRNFGV